MASPFAPGINEANISAKYVPIFANLSHVATIRINIIPTVNTVTAIGTYVTIMLRRDGSPRGAIDIAKHPVIIHRGTRGGANKSAIVNLNAIVPASDVDDHSFFTHAHLLFKTWCMIWLAYSIVEVCEWQTEEVVPAGQIQIQRMSRVL